MHHDYENQKNKWILPYSRLPKIDHNEELNLIEIVVYQVQDLDCLLKAR